jgi:hypothetical protein
MISLLFAQKELILLRELNIHILVAELFAIVFNFFNNIKFGNSKEKGIN